ncbi:MAG: alkaline phosphatase D family protein [Alphaproteobacteria bacterium]|nr:alkaline phosphatase D family protein [Alphaproteobacteria bacterium]
MLTRRALLQLAAAAVPGLLVGCGAGFDPDAVPESITRFPRTPMSGDVTSTRAVLTFHVADDTPVVLRVWTGEEVVLDSAIEPNGDGFHKVMVDDLVPGTEYHYAVFSGKPRRFEERSLIGRFRTWPSEDTREPVSIALLACVGQGTILPDYYYPEGMPVPTTEPIQWEVFTHAREHDLDAIVHLGDQAYLDYVWELQDGTVEAYLNAWGAFHGGGYRDVYPLAPLYATWDDHEATDNSDFDPWDTTPEIDAKVANAQEAWYRVMPIDAMTPSEAPVWRSFRFGGTVELVLLDCRYELQEDHLMSTAQLDFLLDRIESSPCRFVCVATPRPFANITSDPALAADNQDRWEAYTADRGRVTALLDALDARHVVFVAGDLHMNYLGRVSLEGDAPSQDAWEVCVTSGNVNPLAGGLSREQFELVDTRPHLPILTFDPDAGTIHVAFYARDGSLTFERTLDDV